MAIEAQAENEDQLQLATAVEITELRQLVQQQAKLMQKWAEEAKNRENELMRRQTSYLRRLCRSFQFLRVKIEQVLQLNKCDQRLGYNLHNLSKSCG